MAKAYNPIGWENGTKEADAYVTIGGVDYDVTPEQWDGNTPVDATNLDHMEKGIENSFDVKIIAYTDTEPSECATGDVYYNTTNKLLYTATGTDTWSSNGSEPLEGILYILFDSETETGTSYSWDGSDLISVGGGGGADEVVISDEEPTTDDWKIWIDSGQVNNLGSEVVDTLTGNETNLAPSVRAVKEDLNTYSTTEQRIGTYLGKPLYRKIVTGVINASSTSGTFQDTYITIDNSIEDFVDITTKGVINTLSRPVFIPYTFQDVSLRIYINTFTHGAVMYSNSSTYSVNVTITALYTKTTD